MNGQKYFQSRIALVLILGLLLESCHSGAKKQGANAAQNSDSAKIGDKLSCCTSNLSTRIGNLKNDSFTSQNGTDKNASLDDMVFISGGTFVMGVIQYGADRINFRGMK